MIKKFLQTMVADIQQSEIKNRVLICEDTHLYEFHMTTIAGFIRRELIDSLSLINCGLEDKHLKILCKAFENIKSLKKLDFRRNSITNAGLIYLIESLSQKSKVTTINISNNLITIEVLPELLPILHKNKFLEAFYWLESKFIEDGNIQSHFKNNKLISVNINILNMIQGEISRITFISNDLKLIDLTVLNQLDIKLNSHKQKVKIEFQNNELLSRVNKRIDTLLELMVILKETHLAVQKPSDILALYSQLDRLKSFLRDFLKSDQAYDGIKKMVHRTIEILSVFTVEAHILKLKTDLNSLKNDLQNHVYKVGLFGFGGADHLLNGTKKKIPKTANAIITEIEDHLQSNKLEPLLECHSMCMDFLKNWNVSRGPLRAWRSAETIQFIGQLQTKYV